MSSKSGIKKVQRDRARAPEKKRSVSERQTAIVRRFLRRQKGKS